ncbi:class I SAM-dependent methyltransferase [Mycobacterium intracellulare]|uniref:SAM-dependent methyltransferase n=2 Tax=Mycobacterium intracellulare TaxID=1767 RepID=A0A7R7RPS9_MYCIT|nr:class I SAM-dependent methyltransferase [Mycobacterium intracellulare]PBA22953.1 class I SAM-dependent methyltransferase [Mycobacterium intracellulare]BCO58025.1 SAM-dependent methyltransferase [Mycobacterium intracellulare]BCO95204.1 SAM-dependent methyltransferase [Mycobacterium intracellulare]BCP00427.1 SAM-dependent methyltransferase [Mycobacterium intracellulare]
MPTTQRAPLSLGLGGPRLTGIDEDGIQPMTREYTQAAQALIETQARFARGSIERASVEFGSEWDNAFEQLLARVYRDPLAMADAVKGYAAFAVDSMRRQRRFEVEREYPAKTFAEAAQEVYLNDEYMHTQYLPGLLLSHYLWPHHYLQLQYFERFFLPSLAKEARPRFAEVGIGTGVYSRTALQAVSKAEGVGYDLSPVSVNFTLAHLEAFGLLDRYDTSLRDVIAQPPEDQISHVICVEVLEHLEDPVALLRALKNMTAPAGKLFITAALNAANADHIYLYRNAEDVLAQAEESGLHVEHYYFANAYPAPTRGVPVPGAMAMVCTPER